MSDNYRIHYICPKCQKQFSRLERLIMTTDKRRQSRGRDPIVESPVLAADVKIGQRVKHLNVTGKITNLYSDTGHVEVLFDDGELSRVEEWKVSSTGPEGRELFVIFEKKTGRHFWSDVPF